jgi:hypothetical protein
VLGRDVGDFLVHADIENVGDAGVGDSGGAAGFGGDLSQALSPRAVEHDLFLETLNTLSHGEKSTPLSRATKRAEEPV